MEHAGQFRALVKFAARSRIGFDSGVAITHSANPGSLALAREAVDRLRKAGINDVPVEVVSSSALLGRGESRRPAVLFATGPGMGGLGE